MQQTTDGPVLTMTSQPRDSLTSRDTYVITTGTRKHAITVHGNRGNGVHDTTSVLTASGGGHVTTLPDVTSETTGSGGVETVAAPGGDSLNYSSDRATVVAVLCICVILLATVIVATILIVRYVWWIHFYSTMHCK